MISSFRDKMFLLVHFGLFILTCCYQKNLIADISFVVTHLAMIVSSIFASTSINIGLKLMLISFNLIMMINLLHLIQLPNVHINLKINSLYICTFISEVGSFIVLPIANIDMVYYIIMIIAFIMMIIFENKSLKNICYFVYVYSFTKSLKLI